MRGTQIEGFFLSFSEDELKAVREELERLEYTPDAQGMRNYLLDAMFGERVGATNASPDENPTEEFIRKARDYVAKNPEKIQVGIDVVKGLVRMAGRLRK